MPEFSVVSAYSGAVAFALLTLLLIHGHRGSPVGRRLILASTMTALWLGLQGAYYGSSAQVLDVATLRLLGIARSAAWCLVIMSFCTVDAGAVLYRRFRFFRLALWIEIAVAVAGLSPHFLPLGLDPDLLRKPVFLVVLSIATTALILIEQIYRNAHRDARWAVKHLFFALTLLFGYDFALYADAALFNQMNPDMWAARGAVNALAVPFILLATLRNSEEWQTRLFVSRKVVFHSTVALAAGIYLLLMSLAGYLLKLYGGSWGGALRIVSVFGGLVLLVALASSEELRSRLRVFIAKHFYRNKYDYGEVWLRFTNQLAGMGNDPAELAATVLKGIADTLDSTGGAMWQKTATGDFTLVAQWALDLPYREAIPGSHPLVRRLVRDESVIDLGAEASRTTLHETTDIPTWLLHVPRTWVVVPIVYGDQLMAIILLAEPRTNADLTWEDRDVLKTLGRQAASYLALAAATEALADARQFEAFNRLSAFLVHDLKNVVAQLSLVVHNAARHRKNPEFIDDAFKTVGDAVAKVNRMLTTLRQKQTHESAIEPLDVGEVLDAALAQLGAATRPAPVLHLPDDRLYVVGGRDRLVAVFEHLLQNAQEATPDSGRIDVRVAASGGTVTIEIADTGCGMSQEFIDKRLFRPFDTTKGKAGMGIGVYESLHAVTGMGGQLTVQSMPGAGTTFRFTLPAAAPAGRHGAAGPRPARGAA